MSLVSLVTDLGLDAERLQQRCCVPGGLRHPVIGTVHADAVAAKVMDDPVGDGPGVLGGALAARGAHRAPLRAASNWVILAASSSAVGARNTTGGVERRSRA